MQMVFTIGKTGAGGGYIRETKCLTLFVTLGRSKDILSSALDPQKYVDPRIRIQWAKYQPKLQQKNLLSKPKSELSKKERI